MKLGLFPPGSTANFAGFGYPSPVSTRAKRGLRSRHNEIRPTETTRATLQSYWLAASTALFSSRAPMLTAFVSC